MILRKLFIASHEPPLGVSTPTMALSRVRTPSIAIIYKMMIASLAGILIWGCTSPTDTNDEPEPIIETYISVEARPSAIPANGTSKLVIFTEFRINGEAAPDSTRIILLNTIGTLGRGELYTMDGIAIDTLTSDTTVALGMIYAVTSGVRDSVEIAFEPVE